MNRERLSWKRRATLAALCIPAILLCGCAGELPTEPVQVVATPGLQGFAADLDNLRLELRIPGMAAAVAQGDEIVWSSGFGYADVEAGRPATDTTSFYVASVTKPIGAIVVMQLVEQGLVDLDTPLAHYGLPIENANGIKVRNLLNHTSEISPIGTVFRYAHNQYIYLTDVILGATQRTFADLLAERVLRPLHLRNTAPCLDQLADFYAAGLDRQAFLRNLARPYEAIGGRVVPASYPRHFSPAAGLMTSARDLARISIALDQGDLLGGEARALMLSPSISIADDGRAYGLGWFVQTYNGMTLEWHYGEIYAQSALLLRVRERHLTFVVLANTRWMSSAYDLGSGDVMKSEVAQLFMNEWVLGSQ